MYVTALYFFPSPTTIIFWYNTHDPTQLHQRYLHCTYFDMNEDQFDLIGLHTYIRYPQKEDVNDSKAGRD